jgi:hypothetical protein
VSGRKITGGAERALSTAIQRDRERLTGSNGEGPDPYFEDTRPLLVMPVATIAAGTGGNCIVHNGGSSSRQIQGIARLQNFPANVYCLALDVGEPVYELVPLANAPGGGSGGGGSSPCNCLQCASADAPVTSDCSSVAPMAQFWTISVGTTNFGCPGLPQAGLVLLSPAGGCTWESQPFPLGTSLGNGTWLLAIGSPNVTLTLTIDSTHQLVYRCPVANWSGLCANTLTLWQPNQLPNGCTPPCTLCVTPNNGGTTKCLACATIPQTASFATTGISGCASLNGTFELTISLQNPGRCLFYSNNAYCGQGVFSWVFSIEPQPNGNTVFALALGAGIVVYSAELAGSYCQNAVINMPLQSVQPGTGILGFPAAIVVTMGGA